MAVVRTVSVELTCDEAKYIFHALNELKTACAEKVQADEDGDDNFTHMYANDVMQARIIHKKLSSLAIPVFGEPSLVFSYELL